VTPSLSARVTSRTLACRGTVRPSNIGQQEGYASSMRRGTVPVAALAVVAAAALLLARSDSGQTAEPKPPSQPAWVTEAVTWIRRAFAGNPEPVSVRYHQGRESATVTIRFRDSAICSSCSAPAGVALPRGRVATLSVDPRTHQTVGFSVAHERRAAAASTSVNHLSRLHPFPRPTGPARTVASIRTLRTHRLIVLQDWRSPTGVGTTLSTPGGISRGCCVQPPRRTELSIHPEQIGTLPRPGMLLLWGGVGASINILQLRYEDKTQVPVPIQNHYALFQVSPGKLRRGHRPVELIGRNMSGSIVTRQRVGSLLH
jgi:hypothetical protein